MGSERAARLVEQLQDAANALIGVVERVYTTPQGLMTDLVASGFPRTTRERVRTDG